MKLTLEMYDKTYSIESSSNDFNANELLEDFSRLMVVAGYPPNVILPADGGRYECEYKEDDEQN